jgi:polyisoprenoid-binding protein YceI
VAQDEELIELDEPELSPTTGRKDDLFDARLLLKSGGSSEGDQEKGEGHDTDNTRSRSPGGVALDPFSYLESYNPARNRSLTHITMKQITTILSLALPILVLSSLAPADRRPVEVAAPLEVAEAYTVDLGHSTIFFKVNHIGVSNSYGRFNKFSGDLRWAPDDLSQTSVTIEVDAASVDSNNEGRDDHLRGPDFFSVKEFPTWSFQSKEIKAIAEDRYAVTGDITMRGKTEELTFEMEKTGEAEAERFGKKIGFEAKFTLQRTKFGISYMTPGIGDDVDVTLSIEANLAKD